MVQLKEPSFGVLDDSVWTTTPAFSIPSSGQDPTSPDEVHVMAWLEPMTHASPPPGEFTLIEPEEAVDVVGLIVNVLALVAEIAALDVLVMRIR